MNTLRKVLSFKIWLPVLGVGLFGALLIPVMYQASDDVVMMKRSPEMGEVMNDAPDLRASVPAPAPKPIDWPQLISSICVGLGSLAATIRGLIELLRLLLPKKPATP